MPYLRNRLAWATPVEVDLFGAHLDAYINLLPTVAVLRLCHRHGKASAISKIPVELLVLIEDFLTESERDKTREIWQAEYKCFQDKCEPMDHYDRSRVNDWRRMIRLDTARSEALAAEDVDERVNEFIIDHTGYFDVHMERGECWVERSESVGVVSKNQQRKRREIMMKHFGLDFWFSRTRVAGESDNHGYSAAEATLAYLKLPQSHNGGRWFDLSPEERDNKQFCFMASSAMEIVGDLALPADGRAKMRRCLSFLGLKPHKHETEHTGELSARDIPMDEREKSINTWPRLTVLSELGASTDDYAESS